MRRVRRRVRHRFELGEAQVRRAPDVEEAGAGHDAERHGLPQLPEPPPAKRTKGRHLGVERPQPKVGGGPQRAAFTDAVTVRFPLAL